VCNAIPQDCARSTWHWHSPNCIACPASYCRRGEWRSLCLTLQSQRTCCRVRKPIRWEAMSGSLTHCLMASVGRLTPSAAAAAAAAAAASCSGGGAGCQEGGPCSGGMSQAGQSVRW
jgi:hypothetical protein